MANSPLETASSTQMPSSSPTQSTLARDSKIISTPLLSNALSSPLPSDDEHDHREIKNFLASSTPTERDPSSPDKKLERSCCPTSEWMCVGVLFPIVESDSDSQNERQDWCNLHFMSNKKTSDGRIVDDHKTLGGIEDGESISSLPTLGQKAFGDLDSIPSVNTTMIPLFNSQMEQEIDDGSTIASLANLSVLEVRVDEAIMRTEQPLYDDDESNQSGVTMDSARVDAAIEMKLKQIVSIDELIANSTLLSEASQGNEREIKRFGRMAGKSSKRMTSTEAVHNEESKVSTLKSHRKELVRELRNSIDQYGRYDIRCANVTAALGENFDELMEYNQALKLQKEVVSIYSTKLGDHHVTTINAKIQLGKILEKTGDVDSAIEMYYNVLNMRRTLNGDKDSSVPDAIIFISNALKSKGRSEQAIKELKKALKMYRESLGDSHPRVTSTVDEISALYIVVGDFTKAAAILEEVVKLKAATLGIHNTDIAQTLLHLATAYECNGDYTKAMKSLKKAYTVYAGVKGDTSEEATNALKRIALNYKISGDTARGVAAYLGILRGRKTELGDTHPLVAKTYLELGIALKENSQPDKALKCMKQALAIYIGEGKNIQEVEMIPEVMREMALTHKSNGQVGEAIKIFKQELTIRQKMGEESERSKVAKTLQNLGNSELELRNHTKAINYFMEALAMYEKLDDVLSIDFAETLYCTGKVFEATQHDDSAKEAFLEALQIFRIHGADTTVQVLEVTKKLELLGHSFEEGIGD